MRRGRGVEGKPGRDGRVIGPTGIVVAAAGFGCAAGTTGSAGASGSAGTSVAAGGTSVAAGAGTRTKIVLMRNLSE
ncbi:hypothetical protein FCM35_KLT13932 [Carex littledalei]|uniref:Uncharacterized protein n=1 Tax=Carex littledalei TaxID=544730 RepID=A0A833V0D1_9POAL|nr:hypothetical protein FCM35_KLT13932 [Carex littledalei]